MKVLIVDDDQDILNMINAFLSHYKGINIITSKNGEEAYQIIMKESPDLAIIDGLIPGIHGFELCKKVKEDTGLQKPPKIIIMSGIYKGLKYKFEVIKTYHADDYLEKPIRKEELITKIEALTGPLELKEDSAAGVEAPEAATVEMPEARIESRLDPETRKTIDALYGKCEGLGHYGILGANNKATLDEIKAAYREAVKKYHPDVYSHLGNDSLRDKLCEIFSHISVAYSTLSNPEKRKEYDNVLLTIKPARLKTVQNKARSAFEEGKNYLREERYQEAEHFFQEAAYYDATISEYHYYYGLSLAIQNKFREAEKELEAARRLEPHNARYLSELGLVYLELGFPVRAKGLFEKALSISPDNTRAADGLMKIKDIRKRAKK
ncbi:MAG: response regulator [Nitrospirae bacterium]|nr:response regulator [Nitrospirota bacterium]